MNSRIIVAGSDFLTTEIYETAMLLGHEVIILDLLGNSRLDNVKVIKVNEVTDEFRTLPIIMGSAQYPEFESLPFLDHMRKNRIKLLAEIEEIGFTNWTSVIHPSAVIATSAKIGPNVFIGANSTISSNSKVSSGTRINRDVSIGHDVAIGSFCDIAPGVTIAGLANIEDSVFIGAGSILINGVSVGSSASVAAGSIVTRNVRSSTLVMGSPARTKNLLLRRIRKKILFEIKRILKILGLFSFAKAVFLWWKS